MKKKKKPNLHLLIPTLNLAGGAEKIFHMLCQHLDPEKATISIILLDTSTYPLPQVPPHITIYDLNCQRQRYTAWPLWRHLMKTKPDIILSTHFPLDILLSILSHFLTYKPKLISRCITSPLHLNAHKVLNTLYKLSINHFHSIIAQSQDMKNILQRYIKGPKKIIPITNPIDHHEIINFNTQIPPKEYDNDSIKLVSIGRLSQEKNFEFMIKSMTQLSPKFKLYILGNGELKPHLSSLISQLKLSNRVFLLGHKTPVYSYLFHADLFLSTSKYEGCPNAVIEALSCGLPVISLNYGAIYDLIEHEKNGLIVTKQDPNVFSDATEKAHHLSFNRPKIQKEALIKHSLNHTIQEYEDVLYK
tara:strand:+ start:63 stop:1142 length:1080 start_codon:yes stop_codon:yes gene_type:complete